MPCGIAESLCHTGPPRSSVLFLKTGTHLDRDRSNLQAEIEKNTVYGTWQADAFIVGPDSSGEFCHMLEIK